MFAEVLERLGRRQDLTTDQALASMNAIMDGKATPVEISALLVGLEMKGPRASEIVGLARAMRDHALPLPRGRGRVPSPGITEIACESVIDEDGTRPLLDLCGTGGDRSGTFNISSLAAIVVAACGVRVAKHGNRGVSSACGSADLFEALGVRTAAPPETVARSLEQAGIAFLFAPTFHPSMRHAAPVRRELKMRTAFNLLGPLTNPARPTHQLIGVPRPELTGLVARALVSLGCERAWVVHGAGGLDELSTAGYSKVSECRNGSVNSFYVHPSDFGLPAARLEALSGGSVAANASIAGLVLEGSQGPARDVVAMNAAAALFIAGRAGSLEEGVALAENAILTGAASRTLALMARLSREDGSEAGVA